MQHIPEDKVGEIRAKKIQNGEIFYLMIFPGKNVEKVTPTWVKYKDIENRYQFVSDYEDIVTKPEDKWIWDYYDGQEWINFDAQNTTLFEKNYRKHELSFNTPDEYVVNLVEMFMVKDYKLYVIRRMYKYWLSYCCGYHIPFSDW